MRYEDRSGDTIKVYFFNGTKANCWISSTPACGVVAHTSAGYGCRCNYHSRLATFVLEPRS